MCLSERENQEVEGMERLVGCSIEMEPRTLHGGEMSNAREAAVEIIQNKECNEALNIFTEGMKTVVSIEEMEKRIERENQQQKLIQNVETSNKSWAFPCTASTFEESPDMTEIREPLSSPF